MSVCVSLKATDCGITRNTRLGRFCQYWQYHRSHTPGRQESYQRFHLHTVSLYCRTIHQHTTSPKPHGDQARSIVLCVPRAVATGQLTPLLPYRYLPPPKHYIASVSVQAHTHQTALHLRCSLPQRYRGALPKRTTGTLTPPLTHSLHHSAASYPPLSRPRSTRNSLWSTID